MNKPETAASKQHREGAGNTHAQAGAASASHATESARPARASSNGDKNVNDAEDSLFVERALAGDSEAFEALFLKYRQRVFSVAWRLLRDEDSALDVVQDAFVKAYEQLEKLRGDSRFFPWIRRIAINLSIDRLRHLKRGVEVELDERRVGTGGGDDSGDDTSGVGLMVSKGGSESPQRRAEIGEFSVAFGVAITKLSEAHRTVFLLHASEGLSYKEIAETLNCNMGTVMSRLFYARKRLQELLGAHL